MTALDRVLDKVHHHKRIADDEYLASCPVADHGQGKGDRNPSLSVLYRDDKVLLFCHGGCHVQDVLVALGMDWPDLWDTPYSGTRGVRVASWTYTDPSGAPYLLVERWQDGTGKKFKQKIPDTDEYRLPSGFKPCLYRLPRVLAQAREHGEVWVVEGEKCVHAAESLGLVATTSPGGAGKWRDYYATWLDGASCVNIIVDNDDK